MGTRRHFPSLMLLSLMLAFVVAGTLHCRDDGDDDDDDHDTDDDNDDNDNDIHDDDSVDDDDDSGDDDSVDDDDNDNDDDIDDDDDDDSVDDDDDSTDDDTGLLPGETILGGPCPYQGTIYEDGTWRIELVEGGVPGANGIAAVPDPDGTLWIAATYGAVMCLYHATTSGEVTDSTAIEVGAVYPKLARSKAGTLNLTYYNRRDGVVRHATRQGGEWRATTVTAATIDDARRLDLALGPQGKPRVAYQDANRRVRFATIDATAWQVTDVAQPANDTEVAVAVDDSGRALVVYRDGAQLLYRRETWLGWGAAQPLEATLDEAQASLDALAANGRLYVAFGDGVYLRLATLTDAAVVTKTAAQLGDYGARFLQVELRAARGKLWIGCDANFEYVDDDDTKGGPDYPKAEIQDSGYHLGNEIVPGTFSFESLDHRGATDHAVPVIDAAGVPHVVYYNNVSYKSAAGLILASPPTGLFSHQWSHSWTHWTTVFSRGCGSPALTIDGNGEPEAVIGHGDAEMLWARHTADGWMRETFTMDKGSVGAPVALAAYGIVPHVFFVDYRVLYATRTDDGWATESIWGKTSRRGSIAVDNDGQVFMAFQTTVVSFPELRIAYGNAGAWTIKILDNQGPTGLEPSLELDTAGNVHIGYLHETPTRLMYGTNASGAWVTEVVTEDAKEEGAALGLDAAGRPSIAYLASDGALHLTTRSADGTWSDEVVHTDTLRLDYPSVAIGADGTPYVSFERYQEGASQVYFASRRGGNWTVAPVYHGGVPRLALDGAGRPVVAFESDGAFCVATPAE